MQTHFFSLPLWTNVPPVLTPHSQLTGTEPIDHILEDLDQAFQWAARG